MNMNTSNDFSGSQDVYDSLTSMSDEDFLNLSPKDFSKLMSKTNNETTEEDDTNNLNKVDASKENTLSTNDEEDSSNEDDTNSSEELNEEVNDTTKESNSDEDDLSTEDTDTDKDLDSSSSDTSELKSKESASDNLESSEDKTDTSKEDTNYKELYERIMAPFKANGKVIKLDTPEEVISLMQMGANYTRKMQEIQPYKKLLVMLQNNDLMDESKISYLLDIKNKNPEAIKKLIKESNIDPFELDLTSEPNYTPNNYSISDAELNLRNTIEEVTASQSGRDIFNSLGSMDAASQEAIYKEPELLKVLANQKDLGIYDVIVNAVDKQRLLGNISPSVSFISAYYTVGEQLNKLGYFDNTNTNPNTNTKSNNLLATKTAKPSTTSSNNSNRVKAASSTRKAVNRSNSNNSKEEVYKKMTEASDADFLKMFNTVRDKL